MLNLNLHFPALAPNGVFFEESEGVVLFHPLPTPTVPDPEKLARRLIPCLVKKLAAESKQAKDAARMHLLTQYLQAQSLRTAPVMKRPCGLRIFAESSSLHDGSLSPSWMATRSNDSVATALVRCYHSSESLRTQTARPFIERSSRRFRGGAPLTEAISRLNRRAYATA